MKKQNKKSIEEYERSFKSKNFIEALKNAFRGIFYTIKTQRNIKIQILLAIIAIILAVLLKCTLIEVAILAISISFVLFAEMLNTAIETTVDLITQEYDIRAKIAKDIMAGSVLLTSLNAVVIGCLIFIEKIVQFFS